MMSAQLLADVRTGQQSAVHQGLEAVMLHHRGARHLFHETGTEYALDSAPGVVRPQGKIETGLRMVTLQYFHQARHTFARTAIGINVDLESDLFHKTMLSTGIQDTGFRASGVHSASQYPRISVSCL